MREVRAGQSPYEAHARATMGWTGGVLKKENPQMYLLSKSRILSLSYGAGFVKFITMARMYVGDEAFRLIFEKAPTEEELFRFQDYLNYFVKKGKPELRDKWASLPERDQWVWVQAWLQVSDFRASNPKITAFWKMLGDGLAASVGDTYEVELPSGRSLKYFNVTKVGGEFRVRTTRLGNFSRLYAPMICENVIQAAARDVFADGLRRVVEAGYRVIFHVHDEMIIEAPEGTDPSPIVKMMSTAPKWWPTLPVGAEAAVSKHYMK